MSGVSRVRLWGGLAAVLTVTAMAPGSDPVRAQGHSQHQQSAAGPIDPSWLSFDSASRTVRFKLIAGLTGQVKSPFNFNGFVDGELTLLVPESATVVLDFVNQDGTPHSAVVIPDKDPMPTMADAPAIPRAFTTKAAEGLGYYARDVVRFRAAPAGAYRIFCGVPGHGLSGMWIRFRVDPGVTRPELILTQGKT